MKYSEKYSETNIVHYGVFSYEVTKPLLELYETNESFDASILFTSSDFLLSELSLYKNFGRGRNFFEFVDNETHVIKDIETTNCKIGIGFVYTETFSKPQFTWSKYDNNTKVAVGDDICFVKNIDLKNLLFLVNASGIGTIDDIVSENISWFSIAESGITITTHQSYNGRYYKIPVYPVIVVYDNDKICYVATIDSLLSLNGFGGLYYTDFETDYLFSNYNNVLYNYENGTQYTVYKKLDVTGKKLGEQTGVLFEDDFIKISDYVGESSVGSLTTKLSNIFISNFLSSCCCYFTNYPMYEGTEIDFDTLLNSGSLWLGEMVDGKATGKWLHTSNEITSAENYDINSENEKFNPDEQTEKDEIKSMFNYDYFNYGVSGFVRYYALTPDELSSLSNEISNSEIVPEGYNIFENIVSLAATPISVSDYVPFITRENIKIGNIDNFQTTAIHITSQKTFVTLCDYFITPIYNDFRDYTPYSEYQLYLPMYGTVSLSDMCVNRRLIVKRNSDITQGDFIYLICYADNEGNIDIVDKISIKISTPVEFTAENAAIKNISILQNQLSTVNSIVSGVSSVATGNVFGVASSISNIASSVINTDIAKNKNYLTHISENRSAAGLHDCLSIFLIIHKSDFIKDDGFGNSKGYIFNKTDTLGNHSGFCTCCNVDIELNAPATLTEQTEIRETLETGFII